MWEQLKVPIVPLIFYGAYELYPASSWVNNTGRVTLWGIDKMWWTFPPELNLPRYSTYYIFKSSNGQNMFILRNRLIFSLMLSVPLLSSSLCLLPCFYELMHAHVYLFVYHYILQSIKPPRSIFSYLLILIYHTHRICIRKSVCTVFRSYTVRRGKR